MTKRLEKVNELIKEIVSKIVLENLQFPEGVLVTITRAVVSPDIHYANIFYTVLSVPKKEAEDQRAVTHIFKEKVGSIQWELNRSLRMRPVPKITFVLDKDEERREKIESLLAGSEKNNTAKE